KVQILVFSAKFSRTRTRTRTRTRRSKRLEDEGEYDVVAALPRYELWLVGEAVNHDGLAHEPLMSGD
ncbi:MAG TPA: hypothetical protein VE242_01795, partial [Chthoniobacterales bacterium]|nr:hypothetical protein [Chthoniobacterales bacterium]